MQRKLLGVYKILPCELFRVNNTAEVRLRDYAIQTKLKRRSYDLRLDKSGLVQPSKSGNFDGPNGMSLRPNSPFFQELVRAFESRDTIVCRLPKGLNLEPLDLTLFWEHTDHHSIQTTVPIKLDELNAKLTKLCKNEGTIMTKDEFLEKYPYEKSF